MLYAEIHLQKIQEIIQSLQIQKTYRRKES